jgi:aldehyde:ferredoxin oxidoreductase
MEEVNGVLGTKYTVEDAAELGAEILRKERAFNEAAGFTKVHDRLPEFMRTEKLAPHNNIFDVPDEALDKVYGEL